MGFIVSIFLLAFPLIFIVLIILFLVIAEWQLQKKKRLVAYVEDLKSILPNDQFTIVAWLPFFVISDEEADDVMFRTKHTIDWAAKKLKEAFFRKDPDLTCIWLFKDQESYKTCMEKWHGKTRYLPGGFFAENNNSMAMNISLGNGVVVHEMAHAYMYANFRKCPPWFHEGLASLYIRCNEESGEIRGHPDESLVEIQRSIHGKNVLPFDMLFAMRKNEFYLEWFKRCNYVQAQYICYYLQQQGLLKNFYHAFYKNHRHDPTGFKTLKKVVGYDDMRQFQKDWEEFILALPSPERV